MLCYRCGSHVPDGAAKCMVCGQPLSGNRRPAAASEDKAKGPGPLSDGELFADRYLIHELIAIGTIGWLYKA